MSNYIPDDVLCKAGKAFNEVVFRHGTIADALRAALTATREANAEPSEYYRRCAKMVEELRAMLGHGYGEGDFEHMTSIIKARNDQWDKLERDSHAQ